MEKISFNATSDKTGGKKRSGKWPALRRKFLAGKSCAVCGGKKKLEAHHVIPFSLDPSKELDEKNLIPLCEDKKTLNCHLIIGHGGDYKDYNPYCRRSAHFLHWLLKFRQKAFPTCRDARRPKGTGTGAP